MGRKIQSAVKRAAGSAAKRGARRLIPWKYRFLLLLLLFGLLLGATFVPEESVPEPLKGVHGFLLAKRNSAVRSTGLPVSLYEDCVTIENADSSPVRIYFAPSPKISSALSEFISSAQSTVHVCIYDLDLEDVTDALIEAFRRGVKVRVVTDTDNYGLPTIRRMLETGIEIVPDGRKSIMHNKFVIVDAQYVWTGSFNFTKNCAGRNDNNALIFESPEIAAGYLEKFGEYWNGRFSRNAVQRSMHNRRKVGNIPMEFYFSPADGVRNVILKELSQAKECVDVMAFSFTDEATAKMLASLVRKGVKVRCLLDLGQGAGQFSRKDFLRKAGVELTVSPNYSGKMHHKVILIDRRTLITGSYNYSKNAEENNDENILILRSPEIVRNYTKEFNRCLRGTKGY